MKAPLLESKNAPLRLIEPNVERDSQLGVEWLNGELGRVTMRSMGNTEETINKMLPATLMQEQKRVSNFLEREDQLNWMIEYEGRVVGTVWVDLTASKDIPSPSVHIMIGDPDMRGKGLGNATVGTVLEYLDGQGHDVIYSRHLVSNDGADKLLKSLGFTELGEPYFNNTLEFQNLIRKSK